MSRKLGISSNLAVLILLSVLQFIFQSNFSYIFTVNYSDYSLHMF